MQPARLAPKKSLGQHFLHDANIARNIVALLAPTADDLVVEIGPGEGVLTALLAATGARVIAVDVDVRAVALITSRIAAEQWTNVEVLHADILALDLAALARARGARLRVIGNLPYYITSQILFALYDAHPHVRDAVVMMQREVADRITAPPGTKECGILSVVTALHARVAVSFLVSPNVFTPKPRVWSRVLHLDMQMARDVDAHTYTVFRRLVRDAFGLRRKTLLNSLRHAGYDITALQRDALAAPLLGKRPEALALDDFLALSHVATKTDEGVRPPMPAKLATERRLDADEQDSGAEDGCED